MPNDYTPTTEFNSKCPYTVDMTYEAYAKMRAYILNTENEVSGLGAILLDTEKKTIYVYDIFLLEQTVTGASTVLDPKGMATFFAERQKINPNDDLGDYKLWWHSHYNFGTFWSGTDDSTIESMDQETKEDNWLLSIVGNQKGDMLCRLDVFAPIRMTFNHVPLTVSEVPTAMNEAVIAEIKEKVHEPPTTPAWNSSGWKGWGKGKNGKEVKINESNLGGQLYERNEDNIYLPAGQRADEDDLYPGYDYDQEDETTDQIVNEVAAKVKLDMNYIASKKSQVPKEVN